MSRVRRLALLLGAVLMLLAAPAAAVPPDGAGADTPGTSASVSDRTLRAGEVIRFTLSGFPANEVVYVKIDDGRFCAKAGVHGACVVHQQRIPGNGRVSGSFVVPGDVKPGRHWLRFLASQELTDASGSYLGIKGFTCRGNTDFTVVTGSGPPAGTGSTGGATGGSATAEPDATGPAADGSVRTVKAGGTLRVKAPQPSAPAPSEPAPSEAAPIAETPEPVVAAPAASVARPTPEDDRFPVVGTVGLVLLVAAGGGVLLRAGRRRGA